MAAAVTFSATPALAHEFKAGTVTVSHPWARATPKGAKVGAAYFHIEATKAGGDKLIAAKAGVSGRVELHSHVHEGGVMKMRQVQAVDVPAGGDVTFEPSGYHVMLMDLKAPLKEGDLLPITLVFEKAGEIKLEATVEPIGAKGPHGFEDNPATHGKPKAAKGHAH
jgi:copper(I)-binding protein